LVKKRLNTIGVRIPMAKEKNLPRATHIACFAFVVELSII